MDPTISRSISKSNISEKILPRQKSKICGKRFAQIFLKTFCLGILIIMVCVLCIWVLMFDGYQIPHKIRNRAQWKLYNPENVKNFPFNQSANPNIRRVTKEEADRIHERLISLTENWTDEDREIIAGLSPYANASETNIFTNVSTSEELTDPIIEVHDETGTNDSSLIWLFVSNKNDNENENQE